MIALLALAVLYLACAFVCLSWIGGAVLALCILFALWTAQPFGNRLELGMALRWWRELLLGRRRA